MIPKKKTYSTDERKHIHRDSFKGHKTKKHFINTVKDKEAFEEIKAEVSHINKE
jgi:hypothetical protein